MPDDTDAVVAAARECVAIYDEPPPTSGEDVQRFSEAAKVLGDSRIENARRIVALADQRDGTAREAVRLLDDHIKENIVLRNELDAAQAEVTRLRTAVEGVRRTHAAEMCVNGERWCDTCETGWPCPTIEALGDEGERTGE
jgi:hypothetical protein